MKISLVTSLAAIAIPFASAQSSAPSAAAPIESLVPTGLDGETLAPSPAESIVIDPKCSAHALCEAEDLADDCCPTIENVFLDCCDLGDFTPPPPPPTPGTSTPAPATPEPTFTPSTVPAVLPSVSANPTAKVLSSLGKEHCDDHLCGLCEGDCDEVSVTDLFSGLKSFQSRPHKCFFSPDRTISVKET